MHDGYAFWSEFKDGRIYRRRLGGDEDLENVEALTPGKSISQNLDLCVTQAYSANTESEVYRYADFDIHPTHPHLLVCVREDHTEPEPSKVKNGLVLVDMKSKTVQEIRPARAEGFYAFPRFGGKEGSKIAWIEVSAAMNHVSLLSLILACSGNTQICPGKVQRYGILPSRLRT